MAIVSDIKSLQQSATPEVYSARASIGDDGVDATTSSVTGDRTTGLFSRKSGNVNQQDFLTLLVTQLRYQDPMSPMDNAQMVSQLAQFQTLESNLNVEKAIKALDVSYQSTLESQRYSAESVSNASAISLIGKEVRLRETEVTLNGLPHETVPIRVHLGNLAKVNVNILDEDGNVIKTLQASGKDDLNSASVVWDGTKDDGSPAQQGTYTIQIDGEDSNTALYAFVQDKVTGVRFSSEGPRVKIGGKDISIGNILDVSETGQQSAAGDLSFDSAVALIGKTLRVKKDSVAFHAQPNEQVKLRINLGNNEDAQVQIVDKNGEVVEQLNTYSAENVDGVKTITWNGSVNNGDTYAEPGYYSIRIVGQDDDPDLYAFTEGPVDGVSTAGGAIRVRVDGEYVSLEDILDVASTAQSGREGAV
jgi:flagellar basal-body rod modification protein FlgD